MVYIALLEKKKKKMIGTKASIKPTNNNPLSRRQLRLMLCPNTEHNVRNPILVAKKKRNSKLCKKLLKWIKLN